MKKVYTNNKLKKNFSPSNNQILVKNIHSFVPNCMRSEGEGGQIANLGGKTLKLVWLLEENDLKIPK